MENFCDDEFWNFNKTWNSEVPDFSSCFQELIFVSIPCMIFSFIFLINICFLNKPIAHSPLPWTWLNVTKLISSISLLIISSIWYGIIIYEKLHGSHTSTSVFVSSLSKVILFMLSSSIILKHRTHRVVTSWLLSVFWLTFTLCSIVLHRSAILKYISFGLQTPSKIFYLSNLYYPIIYLQLFLSVFPDKKNFSSLHDRNIIENIPFLPFISFCWYSRFIYKGRKRDVELNDFGFLSTKQLARYIRTIFSKKWQYHIFPEKLQSRSLAFTLIKSYWPWLLVAFILDLSVVFSSLLPPLLLDRIIDFVHHDHYPWKGYMYAVIMFAVDFVGKIFVNLAIHYFLLAGLQIRSALMTGVFRKCLMLSTSSRRNFSSGNISSLLSVDIDRLTYLIWTTSTLITLPIKIILIIFLMWQYIGVATLAGIGVLVFLFPFSYFVSRISMKFSDKQMEFKDKRLKYMNEVLCGIKIIKMYAWEIPFGVKVSEARKEELKLVFYSQLCYVFTSFVFFCAPLMVSIASFATFLLSNTKNVLDPTRAFVCLTLMEQLRYAIFSFPDAVAEIVQSNISLGRLKKFFAAANKDLSLVEENPDEGDVLTMKNASFTWAVDKECTLNELELHIPKGKLVAVIGPVGSGKSSLLSAILGEMYKTNGSINLKGSLAYVPQVAWTLNRSLKENILLNKHNVPEKYSKVLDLCCLMPDLKILPAGDETEIGEKGVNLSGGQKQRINLARAVFHDKDVYLLDDTLSAVDVHVGKALFDNVIGNEGILKDKTRIFVTHNLSVLPRVDMIVSMKDGRINEIGSYSELMSHNGSFTNFIREHSNQDISEENQSLIVLPNENIYQLKNGAAGDSIPKDTEDKEYKLTDEEKMESGGVNRVIYWNYVKTLGLPLSLIGFLGYFFHTVFDTAANIWLSKWSADAHNNVTKNMSTTIWRLEIYGSLGIAEAISVLIGSLALAKGTRIASEKYHDKMLNSILRSPMCFFDSTPMGRVTNRFSSDLDVLDTHLFQCIDGWLDSCFSAIAAIYIIGKNAPIFLATILFLGMIYFTFQKWHLATYRQLRRIQSTTKSPIYSLLLESIQGITSIDAFKIQDDFNLSFEEKVDSNILANFSSVSCNRWLNFYLDSIGSIIVLIASVLAIQNHHNLSSAEVALMISYALLITQALKWLVRMNSELENKSVSVERIEEYTHLKSEASWELPGDNICNNWPTAGGVIFNNYCTKYREDLDLVLKNINISVIGNEKVGIIGRTGAGKSSVTLALFRIIEPVSGTIFVDDIDIAEIGLHTLRSKLTIIPQDPVLFNGSLRTNLDPHKNYSDCRLWESLERSHLKSFVSGLDEGLDYELEEGGSNLSAGQRQLLCLARALLKDSKILVLDEATASVDVETDNLIQNTIRTAFVNHTVVTIAHRINTVIDYDKIIVMDNGSVIEVGNPTQLLKNSDSKFHHMCKDAGLI